MRLSITERVGILLIVVGVAIIAAGFYNAGYREAERRSPCSLLGGTTPPSEALFRRVQSCTLQCIAAEADGTKL